MKPVQFTPDELKAEWIAYCKGKGLDPIVEARRQASLGHRGPLEYMHAEIKTEEFGTLLDEYRRRNKKEPDSIDLGTMLRESEERAWKVPPLEATQA